MLKRFFIRVLFLLAFLIFFVLFLDIQVRPVVRDYSKSKINLMSFDIINESIISYLNENNIDYKDLVDINYDSNGNINSLYTNSILINKIKSEISNNISEKLSLIDNEFLNIPLGSLLGINFISGRGPTIKFDIAPVGNVSCDFEHIFNSVGINQTSHKISFNIKVKMMSYIPGYKSFYDINSEFVIAETIIVGKVPSAYVNIEDKSSDLVNKLNDYKELK